MHGRFDLLLKIRAKDLEEMRDIVVNKIRKLPRIIETELMTALKTRKEESYGTYDGCSLLTKDCNCVFRTIFFACLSLKMSTNRDSHHDIFFYHCLHL